MVKPTQPTCVPTAVAVPCLFAFAAAAASCDVLMPASVEAGLFYLPTIVLAAWRFGAPVAVGLSLPAVLIRLLGDDSRSMPAVGWAACSWFGAYCLVVLLTVLLRRSIERERQAARTDTLTGLANRTALQERLEAELNRGRRKATPLSVAYIDCDRFKQVNDRYGHAVGDRVLRQIAIALERGTRDYDLVARPGGDEFVVLFPETTAEHTRIAIGRIQHSLTHVMREHNWDVTFSIGAVTFVELPLSADDAVRAADALMYVVKQAGKNGARFDVRGAELLAGAS